jgi:hypothetical protein
MCSAQANVRFTPNSDQKSRHRTDFAILRPDDKRPMRASPVAM